jgi:hypothetical protein
LSDAKNENVMTATVAIAVFVGSFFLYVIFRMFGSAGRPGINESTSFPFDSGTSIPPPSWSSDSGDAPSCEVGDGASDGDSGGCDGGGNSD